MYRVTLSLLFMYFASITPETSLGSHLVAAAGNEPLCVAPVAIAACGDSGEILVLGAEGALVWLDERGDVSRSVALKTPVTGMTTKGDTAYVTTDTPAGQILAVDLQESPVLSRNGRTLYVANRFDNTVTLLDLETGTARVAEAIREPVALALGQDGARLFVANLLPEVKPFLDDENPFIAAQITVIDTISGRVLKHIELPNGTQNVRGIACAPGGRYVVVTHVLSNYVVPAMGIEGGAMNRNAISLIDTEELHCAATVVLDEADRGAANPWAVAFLPKTPQATPARQIPYKRVVHLLVTHAGTHEVSIIHWPKLLARITKRGTPGSYFDDSVFGMLEGIRQRIPLPVNGPRAIAVRENAVYISGYFSDNIAALDFSCDATAPAVRAISLSGVDKPRSSIEWIGERYFNDASTCFQDWQSCASCHPDGRSDALYWDLLNDGMGNTKNTKSLLMATLTPPAMWRGVRANAAMAVRAGIEHIQFATPKPMQTQAIDAYLEAMKATPSPYLDAEHIEPTKNDDASCGKCHAPGVPRGTLTESARRGKALFEGKAGCAACHPHPYFTTLQSADPGLGSGVLYDIPSLVGVWRTAPYLHSGDALSIEETITDYNYMHRRGNTQDLTQVELDDLVAYVRSL